MGNVENEELLQPMTTLLLDPHPDLQHLISTYFHRRGQPVSLQPDLSKVLDTLGERGGTSYDCTVLPLGKDVAGSIDLIGTIRTRFPGLAIVVFTSALQFPEIKNACIAAGADRYLTKTEGGVIGLYDACMSAFEGAHHAPVN